MSSTLTESAFARLGLPSPLLNVIDRLGFTIPTPIQERAIPLGLEGHDVLGIAQTGTGKTLAFGLPMLARLREHRGMGLVVVPTRELALQVEETLRKVGTALQFKTVVLIGGAPMHRQVLQIRGGAHIIVATPGRLVDHLKQGTLRLDNVRVVILDEADRMLDMGFLPDIRRVMERIPKDRQTSLFSATMPSEIESLSREFMNNPQRVEIARTGTAAELVEQSLLIVPMDDKAETLRRLLGEAVGTVLVFSRTRHGARKTARMVRDFGHSAAELHSDRTLAQRREALDGFKAGKYQVLVATDIAARGIDVKRIELVANYDVPDNPEDYIHRIGRTGRAGETGRAVTIATPQQAGQIHDIERLLGHEIPVSEDSPLRFESRAAARSARSGGRQGGPRSPRPPRPERMSQAPAAEGRSVDPRKTSYRDQNGPAREAPRVADRPARPAPGPATPAPSAHAGGKPQHPGAPAAPSAAPKRAHRGVPTSPSAPAKKKRLPQGPHPYEKFFKSTKKG